MEFPTINFKFTNTETDSELQELLEQKLTSLNKYLGTETDVKCDAEFEKVAPSESGPVFRAEVNLFFAGDLYRAESTCESFSEAIDEVRDELDKELRRKNKKNNTLLRKGGRKIKQLMRFGRS